MSEPVTYLDNNATTRVDPRVLDAMLPFLGENYGNPSSVHWFGARVTAAIEEARHEVARLIHANDSEVVFTSGGTESNNAALRGVLASRPRKRHVIISAVEHHAITEPAAALERKGIDVSRIAVDREGRLDLEALEAAIRDDTLLVSVMLANNETGVVFPLRQVCEIAQARGVYVHTDAIGAVGKLPVDVAASGVDLLSLSGHKIHAPKGVGALFVRRGTPFQATMLGGPQERRKRGGTQNVAGIVALGAACGLLREADGHGASAAARIGALRDRLEREISVRFENAHVIGAANERVSNTSCICFAGISAEPLLMLLSEAGVCVSSGSACSSGSLEPSHVLKAMEVPPEVAQGQIRFSLSRFNSDDDITRVMEVLPGMVSKLAALEGMRS